MSLQPDDLSFLPFLIDEDIYLIESAETTTAVSKPEPAAVPKVEAKIEIPVVPTLPKTEAPKAVVETPAPAPVVNTPVQSVANQLINKKVVIMVGYQSFPTVPPNVQEALEKIFAALNVDLKEVEIINVLATNPPKIENYNFEYLILMGGNGKNLAFMQNFTGTRNRYEIVKHANKTIFFAESMDIYFKDLELKKKFWGKLKEVFKFTTFQASH